MIGKRLGQYEILEELGRGGMGVVYLARQDGLNRLVAIKILAAVDAEFAARLRREAQVLSELHHPHIVSVYDFGETEGTPYFVMAYCAGGSVTDVIAEQGALTVGQAVNVLASVSSALSAMHSHGLVHRDVKPSNVLLSADGQPFLSDLGIVGGDDRSRMTATGSLVGTIGYSAPELLDDVPHNPACDTFSLGVLGYEVVSGLQPFAGRSLSGVLDAIRRGSFPPLSQTAPRVPPKLAALIESAMSVDPAQRPSDLEQFSRAFLTVAPTEHVRPVQRRNAPTVVRAVTPAVAQTRVRGDGRDDATVLRNQPPPPPPPTRITPVAPPGVHTSPRIAPLPAPARGRQPLIVGLIVVAILAVAGLVKLLSQSDDAATSTAAEIEVTIAIDQTPAPTSGTVSVAPTPTTPRTTVMPPTTTTFSGPSVCIKVPIKDQYAVVRSERDVNSLDLAHIPEGMCAPLVELDQVDGWYHVRWQGVDGWTAATNTTRP